MDSLIKQQIDTYEAMQKCFKNYKKDPKIRKTTSNLQNRIATLSEYWIEFKERHKRVIIAEATAEIAEKCKKYLTGEIYSDAQEFYIQAKSEIEEEMLTLTPNGKTAKSGEEQKVVFEKEEVNLPKINLPKFSGDYKMWSSFHDLFVTLIHSNKSLSLVQKLHYLKSSLQGEAEQLLRHFTITDANYNSAWSTLKDRYDNPRILIRAQLKTLFSQPYVAKDSAVALRKLVDTTNECVQSLQNNLNVDTKGWDIILTHIVTERLPPDTKKLWEQHIGSKRDYPKFDELKTFLEGQFRALEALNSPIKANHSKPIQERQVYHVMKTRSCIQCSNPHPLRQCPEFLRLDHNGRRLIVKEKGLCSNCLGQGHISSNCPCKGSCFICKHKHHTLLHDKNAIMNRIDPSQSRRDDTPQRHLMPSTSSFHISHSRALNEVLLATALIKVRNEHGIKTVVRALIDPGSQMTFITESIVQQLRLKGSAITANIKGLGSNATAISRKRVTVIMESLIYPNFEVTAEALVLAHLTDVLPSRHLIRNPAWSHLNGLQLADPQFNKPGKIDMIIGADVYCNIILEGLRTGPEGTPIAQHSSFGWILSGSISKQRNNQVEVVNLHTRADMDDQLRKFWELEEVAVVKYLTSEEQQCEDLYKRTVKRLPTGRYEVKLPFKDNTRPKLGKSKNKAIMRLKYLEVKLNRNPSMQEEYSKCLEEYLILDQMKPVSIPETELVSYDEGNKEKYFCNYLPHHAVCKESTTTKLRVVFDASSKTEGGLSLNDTLLVGPTLQDDIWSILIRWRRHAVAFTADLEKMYRQIKVADEDAQYQRILWRSSSTQSIKEFYLNTVTFGTACAPFLAVRTIQQLATDESHRFPWASQIVRSDFYVDDLLTGTNTISQALKLKDELTNLFKAGGFNLRKWTSNKRELLKTPPTENFEVDGLHPIGLHNGIKTLGIYWCPQADILKYKINIDDQTTTNVTKRQFLSDLSKIFDPLGFLVPIIIHPKILMQSLWLRGTNWDETLPTDIFRSWNSFKAEFKEIENITIPRWIRTCEQEEVIQLHGFCDASIHAYAAAIYARVVLKTGEVQTSLLVAKSKVAPIKQISLPRLELCGATLLARLYNRVRESLNLQFQFQAWTDSSIVLAWLQSHPNRWKVFVANRVSEIQASISGQYWRHVPTEHNPADCATRGLSPKQLKDHQLWWEGPAWLKREEKCWPNKLPHKDIDLEAKIIKVHLATQPTNFVTNTIERFSSLRKLLRVTSICVRFVQRCKKGISYPTWISLEEMNSSLMLWIKRIQEIEFADEIKDLKQNLTIKNSKILKLNPFLDNAGILRVGGRLSNAALPWKEKHPIILPSKHTLTHLIIDEMHMVTLHGNVQLMLGLLRKRFWILDGRNTVRLRIHKCLTCFRLRQETKNQLMGSLPNARITVSKPFSHAAIDYCGPIDIKLNKGRGFRSIKGYLAIFVCFVTRAIHIEVVSELTTAAFLAALKRFTSRRGKPSNIYTDCGTNFVGAKAVLNKELSKYTKKLETEIPQLLATEGINWHFSPPGAPHFNGLCEAGVKSAKFHLKRVLKNSTLTFEELITVTTQIEGCLNSRPLCALNDDPSDTSALTPGHFLTGDAILAIPEPTYLDMKQHLLTRWQHLQQLTQNFWRKWQLDYISSLQQRNKWKAEQRNLERGQLVLVKDERIPPSRWLLARVIDTHKGADNLVRVATLKTKNGILKRPIVKLSLLPIPDNQ